MVVESGFTPDGEQFAEGNETTQPSRELVYVPYEEGLRALLDNAISNVNRPTWAGRSKLWYLHIRLLDKGSELGISGHEEEAQLFENTAIALGIVGYNTLPPSSQYDFRNYLREQIEIRREMIDLGKAEQYGIVQPDSVSLSEQGRKLLQVCTSALDIEYNPLQEQFAFSTVLDQLEIEPPTEEDYLNQTEKAIHWEEA